LKKRWGLLSLLVVVVLIGLFLPAQSWIAEKTVTFPVTITDSASGRPVEGATVELINLFAGDVTGVGRVELSDKHGNAKLITTKVFASGKWPFGRGKIQLTEWVVTVSNKGYEGTRVRVRDVRGNRVDASVRVLPELKVALRRRAADDTQTDN
jgi:hypothetical protein